MSITLPRLIFTLSFVSLYDFLISNSNCIPKSTIVFYNDTVTIRKTEFCFSPSTNFRCSKKEEVIIPSNDTIITCCPGFHKIEENGVIKCRCSKCPVSNMRCDADSEKCVCEDGWIGQFCDNPCPKLHFGPRCEKKCDSGPNTFDCDHVTGRQLCFPGFFGDRCENPCPKGIYCVDGKFCKSPGDCQCPPGRNGTFCEIKVLQDEVTEAEEGPSCNNAGEWDNDRDRCICKPGWQGKICEKRCDHGYYGTDCSTKCPTPSKQSHISRKTSSCDPATGFYKCEVGFKGKICDRCMTCDCPPGYKGNNCDELCEEGRYGINCHQICSCENNATCSPFDGTCTCLAGWSGEKCGDACQSGYYGINCTTRCDFEGHSKGCHHITGELVCSPGYIGPFCNETCPCGRLEKDCPESCETRRSLKSSAQTEAIDEKLLMDLQTPIGFFRRYVWYFIALAACLIAFASANLIVVIFQRKWRRNNGLLLEAPYNYRQFPDKDKEKGEDHQYEEIGVYERGDTYDHLDLKKQRQNFHPNYENSNGKFNWWHI